MPSKIEAVFTMIEIEDSHAPLTVLLRDKGIDPTKPYKMWQDHSTDRIYVVQDSA